MFMFSKVIIKDNNNSSHREEKDVKEVFQKTEIVKKKIFQMFFYAI